MAQKRQVCQPVRVPALRVSVRQDLEARRKSLRELGVHESRIYTDHALTGTNREHPGLETRLSPPFARVICWSLQSWNVWPAPFQMRTIAEELQKRGVKLALSPIVHDPTDPMGKIFFNIVATFAEFEADLIGMRTREGMAIAKAKGKLRGKRPKLSEKQQKELWRMHDTGKYSISDLAEVFSVSRPTVYPTLSRRKIA